MSGTNTWYTPSNGRYYYPQYEEPSQLQVQLQHTPSTSSVTDYSPISPQQLAGWFGNSPVEQSMASGHAHGAYVDEPEELDYELGQEQEEEQEAGIQVPKRERDASDAEESEPASPAPRKRRRRAGEDGERKIRSSRACLICRKSKAKCMPGPSGREPDEDSPCSRCAALNHSCEFTISLRGKYPTKKFARLQRQVEHMEHMHRLLEEALRAKARSRSRSHYTHYLI